MKKPFVTIAIPTYNRAGDYLRFSLESALRQTYEHIEIIVSDNHSTDDTETLVRQYDDRRIRYFRQSENIGPWKNMNFCLEQARGHYFVMLHDDDLIDPDFVQTCLESVNYSCDKGIIIAGAREIDNNGKVITEKPNHCRGMSAYDFLKEWYSKKIVLFLCTILFNTEQLRSVGGFKECYRYFTDVAAEFEMIARTERVDIPDILGSFRANIGSFGKKARVGQWCDDALKLLELGCSLVAEPNGNGELRKLGRKTSAEWMYNEALRSPSGFDRLRSFFVVWSKFKFRCFPTKKQLGIAFPVVNYLRYPLRTARKAIDRYIL